VTFNLNALPQVENLSRFIITKKNAWGFYWVTIACYVQSKSKSRKSPLASVKPENPHKNGSVESTDGKILGSLFYPVLPMLTSINPADMLLSYRKEARGSPLFSYLYGVQKVGSSNLPAPTIASRKAVATI